MYHYCAIRYLSAHLLFFFLNKHRISVSEAVIYQGLCIFICELVSSRL